MECYKMHTFAMGMIGREVETPRLFTNYDTETTENHEKSVLVNIILQLLYLPDVKNVVHKIEKNYKSHW